MNLKQEIINLATNNEIIRTIDVLNHFNGKYSRGWISAVINKLVKENKLLKGGSTKDSFYVLPERKDLIEVSVVYKKKIIREGLEEHVILGEINQTDLYLNLRDNVKSIFNA